MFVLYLQGGPPVPYPPYSAVPPVLQRRAHAGQRTLRRFHTVRLVPPCHAPNRLVPPISGGPLPANALPCFSPRPPLTTRNSPLTLFFLFFPPLTTSLLPPPISRCILGRLLSARAASIFFPSRGILFLGCLPLVCSLICNFYKRALWSCRGRHCHAPGLVRLSLSLFFPLTSLHTRPNTHSLTHICTQQNHHRLPLLCQAPVIIILLTLLAPAHPLVTRRPGPLSVPSSGLPLLFEADWGGPGSRRPSLLASRKPR